MLSLLRTTAVALVGTLALASSALAGEGWLTDFDEAVKVARAEKKDLLVDFTGSDWCGPCMKLDAEVFSRPEFLSEIRQSFVLVSLDFPRTPAAQAKVPNPKRNEELSDKYGVMTFPTILLLNTDGDVLAQTGYKAGGAATYIGHINELHSKARKQMAEVEGLRDAWATATGEAKDAAWDKLATAFEGMPAEHVGKRKLVEPLKAAFAFDEDNGKGRKRRAVALLVGFRSVDAAVYAAALQVEPQNESGLVESALGGLFDSAQDERKLRELLRTLDEFDARKVWKDKAVRFRLQAIAAYWCFEILQDIERAKGYARAAKEIGGTDVQTLAMLDRFLAR